jgi:hypothetical protein
MMTKFGIVERSKPALSSSLPFGIPMPLRIRFGGGL